MSVQVVFEVGFMDGTSVKVETSHDVGGHCSAYTEIAASIETAMKAPQEFVRIGRVFTMKSKITYINYEVKS